MKTFKLKFLTVFVVLVAALAMSGSAMAVSVSGCSADGSATDYGGGTIGTSSYTFNSPNCASLNGRVKVSYYTTLNGGFLKGSGWIYSAPYYFQANDYGVPPGYYTFNADQTFYAINGNTIASPLPAACYWLSQPYEAACTESAYGYLS